MNTPTTNTNINEADVEAGQAVYSNFVLSLYDLWVLGFSNRCLWRCPTPLLEAEFKKHASLNHLDAGVGTGYYPNKCLAKNSAETSTEKKTQRLGLVDLNPNSLQAAAKRNQHFNPETYQANLLAPLEFNCEPFDSLSLNFVFHCLPGNLEDKAVVFKHLTPILNPGATVFGSTILGPGIERSTPANKLMALYNKKGIFSNQEDSLEALNTALQNHFDQFEIRVVGTVAVFTAKV